MSDPTLDPSVFAAVITRDAFRAARLRYWLGWLLTASWMFAAIVVIVGASIGVAKWLAGF